MLEFVIGKSEHNAGSVKSFNVKLMSYNEVNCVVDMRTPTIVCSGQYITESKQANDYGVAHTLDVLNTHNKLKTPIIIFDNISINRELTNVEKLSREAICEFFKCDVKETKLNLIESYGEVIRFKNAIQLLKNKEKVNGMIPVSVGGIAFIELDNTEGDFILSMEAELVSSITAPNGLKFNIYSLW